MLCDVVANHLTGKHHVLHLVCTITKGHDATTASVISFGDVHLYITKDVFDDCSTCAVGSSNHRSWMLVDTLEGSRHIEITYCACHVLEDTAIINGVFPGNADLVSLSVKDSHVWLVRSGTNHGGILAQINV